MPVPHWKIFRSLACREWTHPGQARLHELTISARGAYPGQVPEQEVACRLRAWNEVQHRVTGHLAHLLSGEADGYPGNALIEVLFDFARQGHCEVDLVRALEKVLRLAERVTV